MSLSSLFSAFSGFSREGSPETSPQKGSKEVDSELTSLLEKAMNRV